VIGGFLAIAFVLAAFPLRLWHATRPLVTGVDPYGMDATGKEQDEIVSIYERTWKLNGVKSLSAYQARAHRFQRIADRAADPGRATSLRATAERVRAEIQATQARAALIVIRRRVNRALMGKAAKGYISLFVGGLLLFGISADKLDSERSARVAASKACADAVGAKVLPEKLPPICSGLTESKAPPANADQTRAQGIEALSTAYKSCVDTAVEQERPVGMCDGIKTQLVAAAK
jgi:hypothetical protein